MKISRDICSIISPVGTFYRMHHDNERKMCSFIQGDATKLARSSKKQYKIRNPVVPVASYEIEASLVILTKQRGEKQKLVESC